MFSDEVTVVRYFEDGSDPTHPTPGELLKVTKQVTWNLKIEYREKILSLLERGLEFVRFSAEEPRVT